MQNITGLSFVNNGTLPGYSFSIAEQIWQAALPYNRTAFVIPDHIYRKKYNRLLVIVSDNHHGLELSCHIKIL